MTTSDQNRTDREAFQRLLDVHGATRERWPAADRLRFVQLLSRDPASRHMLAEAEALDRVLDRSPNVGADRIAALAARIAATAADTPQETSVVNVVPFDRRAASGADGSARGVGSHGIRWQAAALLAASLLLGLAIGASGATMPAANVVASLLDGNRESELEFLLGVDGSEEIL